MRPQIGVCAALFVLCNLHSPAFAAVPDPGRDTTYAPDAIVLSPGGRFPSNPVGGYTVVVGGPGGPVAGAFVEVEISSEADALIAWCAAPYGGVGGQAHPIVSGITDVNGEIEFQFYGGGCIEPDAFAGPGFIAQVRVDGVVLKEPYIVSPDAVDRLGSVATDPPPAGGARRCDLIEGVPAIQVSLSDAVYHTPSIKSGIANVCTKFTPPFHSAVGISDAVALTPYVKTSSLCHCQ